MNTDLYVARLIEAAYLAELFERLFEDRCTELKLDPADLRAGDSPIYFLQTAAADEWGACH